jgi:hypothetical protein
MRHLRGEFARTMAASLGTGAIALVAASCDPMVTNDCDGIYTRRVSPDGRFAIVVNRCEMRFAMPGQGGDAPGYVRLVDVTTGKVLEKTDIDMVNTFPSVEWHPHRVSMPLLVEWELPVEWNVPDPPPSLACEGGELPPS